jgi:hypothetical protein
MSMRDPAIHAPVLFDAVSPDVGQCQNMNWLMNRAIHPPAPVIAAVWDTAGLHLDIVVSLSTSDSLPPITTVRP